MNKFFSLIGWNNNRQKRGAYTEAKTLEYYFPNTVKAYDGNSNLNMQNIRENSNRIIYTYQNPNNLINKKLLNPKYYLTDILYIRPNIKTFYKNIATNGFSVYIENPRFIHYIPMMIPTEILIPKNIKKDDTINIGYYLRPQYRPDDFEMFKNFISSINIDVNLYIMGEFIYQFKDLSKHIKKITFTIDNIEFWKNVTHYVYSESKVVDPWPTTLQEAVNLNKQIILLEQPRNFKDGISDIKQCIKYHKLINTDNNYNNSNCILNTWDYNKYYSNLFENNFEYILNRYTFNSILEFLESF